VGFYDDMQVMGNELITEFGQTVTISRITVGTYNPDTGAATTTPATQTGKGIVEEYSAREIDGTNILRGDKRLMLSAVGISRPQINDTVSLSSIVHVIKEVAEINPAGTPVVYICNIRA